MSNGNAIRFDCISKRFPGVVALDKVSLTIRSGTCHALMGENGAGKSTLGKILAGVYQSDEGSIFLNEREVRPANPLEARRLGIAMVHQELAFCPNLSVAENLCLGNLPSRRGWLDKVQMRQQALRMLEEIEADLDPEALMGSLSTAQEQLAQIAAALGIGARIIVMDEPTSSLSTRESQHLFTLLAKLKARGITVIYVSHRMEEIFQLCDSISILRDGCHISTELIAATHRTKVICEMVGRNVEVLQPTHRNRPLGEELLRVEGLSSPGKFKDISFVLHAGEVLGMAGLVGAGRSEVAQALFGLDPAATGRVFMRGNEMTMRSVQSSLAAGIGLLPEDRKRQGLVLALNCRENVALAGLDRWSRHGWVDNKTESRISTEYAQRLRVKTPDMESPIASLSGGNQQKLSLAKWLARACGILILDEPTRGVDVGAKAEMHAIIDELACDGAAVLLISSELPEVMGLSRRILVLRDGQLVGEVQTGIPCQEELMTLMAGNASYPI